MTYDDKLETEIKRHTDEPEYLWEYTYNNLNDELKKIGLPSVCTKDDAEEEIERLQDYLLKTLYYLKDEVKETDLA